MSTIDPGAVVFNDFSTTASPVSAVPPSLFVGVTVSLFAVVLVIAHVVKGLVEALKLITGPLFGLLGVLLMILVLLIAVMVGGASVLMSVPTSGSDSLVLAGK